MKKDLNWFWSLFKTNNRKIKKAKLLNNATIQQFNEIIEDKEIFHASLMNFKLGIYFRLNLVHDDPSFDELMNRLKQDIETKRMIIFDKWTLSWEEKENLIVPVLLNTDDLPPHGDAADYSKSSNTTTSQIWKLITDDIDYLFENEQLHLLITPDIMVYDRVEGKKVALFGEGYLSGQV
ncbi:uncharacterized protein DUF2714 [Mycoplasma testudineum]|uniref:Uncharacterized protein DUF2714 n=1 Tax=Mycoplasma testudineum TaxID=244584 RepID=A0A4R6IC48_9MOLU|nr:DUF2714 domain-containing protein [Mycoplasma testudineum]OYD26684.1 hypothetical protein CG473_02695 [Mycoplasma testudineum]TDO19813.1 uncharacterized protein DUF2714 [Mycoplasma testudineum]